MLTVEDYGQIRRAHRDGMSIRAMARAFHRCRCKIREALAHPQLQGYTRSKDPPAPKLDPFKPIIDGILNADQQAPPKQRHTAMQLFRRLRGEHGYMGGYAQVRRYMQKHRRDRRETFIPLAHDPGQRMECDFGHIQVDFPDGAIVARHARCYERDQQILDPLHYLATLGRRPAALDHSKVYRDWRLPAEFTDLRQRLEQRHGPSAGARQYIRVLQLLAQHPVERVQRAISFADRSPEALGADRIIQHTFRLSQREIGNADTEGVDHRDPILAVQVGMPDLRRFDQLLSQGERAYV